MDRDDSQGLQEHKQTLWCHFANVGLGLWLISSPFAFGLDDNWMEARDLATPTHRGLLLSDTWMTANEILIGLLVMVFGFLSLVRDYGWARWFTAGLGAWLFFSPLLFWTPSAGLMQATRWLAC